MKLLTMPKIMESKFISDHELWFFIAKRDFQAAQLLLKYLFTHQAAYFFQQSAEKALKGYLRANSIAIKRTHELADLITLCKDHNVAFHVLLEFADFLSEYSMRSRYPGPRYEPNLSRYEVGVLMGHANDIITLSLKLL